MFKKVKSILISFLVAISAAAGCAFAVISLAPPQIAGAAEETAGAETAPPCEAVKAAASGSLREASHVEHVPVLTVSGDYKKVYNAFDTFDIFGLVVTSTCMYCSEPLGTVTDFTVKYQNGSCLHVGDTHVIIESGDAETTAEITSVDPILVQASWEYRENGQWRPLSNARSLGYDGAGKRPDIALVFPAHAADTNRLITGKDDSSLIVDGSYRVTADNTAHINVTRDDGDAYSIVDCGTYILSVIDSSFPDYTFGTEGRSISLTVEPYVTEMVWQHEVNGVFEDMAPDAEFPYSGTGRKGVVRARFKAAAHDTATGVSGGYYYVRATDGDRIGITLGGVPVENIMNCGNYTMTFDTSAYGNYVFTGGYSIDFKIVPVKINLRDTDNFYWYLKDYGSALRTGYIDEEFKYYQNESEVPSDKTAVPVTRSIVRYRGDEVTIEIHLSIPVVPDGHTVQDVISVIYSQRCSATNKGKYTAEARLKITDGFKGNYLFVKEGELEPNRHITATINADGTEVTIIKEWYIAEIDNGLRDQYDALHGEWKITDWTFGESKIVHAPRLEHGDEPVGTEAFYVFNQYDNKVKFNLYKIGDDGVERIPIGAHADDGGFNRYDFNNYINMTMPAGTYVLDTFVGSVILDGDHVHWWNNELHTGAAGITFGSFSREFEFTVRAATLEVTDNLRGKRNTYSYDGKLHLYPDSDKPAVRQPLYINAGSRSGEWTKSAYNKYYAQPQVTYNLERWGNNAYRTEEQLLDNHSVNQAPISTGNYHVRYKITAPNYLDYGGAEHVFYVDINKAKVLVPSAQTVTYTGDQMGFKLATGAVYKVDSANSFVNAKEYEVKLKLTDTDNYEWNTRGGVIPEGEKNETVTVKFVIRKAVFNLGGITFPDKTVVYNGEHHTLTIKGSRPVGVRVEYENNDQINPGVYKAVAKFTVTGNAAANYEPIKDKEATLTIKYASLSDGAVVVDSKNGFDPDLTLSAVAVDKSKFKDYNIRGTVESAYTVKLNKDGAEVKPDGSITVKLLMPEAEHKYTVMRVIDGKAEKINYTVEDGYAVVTTSELADFVFAYDLTSASGTDSADNVGIIVTLSVIVVAIAVIVTIALVYNKKSKKQSKDSEDGND